MSDLERIAANIHELCTARLNHEPYSRVLNGTVYRDKHTTQVPSLLDQLTRCLEPGGTGDSGARAVPGSRPAARIEAHDALLAIDHAVGMWLRYCRVPERSTLFGSLHALVGAATTLDGEPLKNLSRESSSWVTWARIHTGWEVPAFQPANTCPICERRGGLRVRVGDGINSADAAAACTHCGETWDNTNIGLLADHMRAENGDEPLGATA